MNKISNQKGLRKRSFEIIRKPDLIGSSFLFNNVRVKLVPYHGQDTHPGTGISFYVNNGNGGVIGVRVYPDGRKEQCNAKPYKHGRKDDHGNEIYLHFRDAWGHHQHITASHAVYSAWSGKSIPEGMTIDHINGCTTNNDVRNLRCVSGAINSRDGGFLRKLRKYGINPATIQRPYLLRYFDRMAIVKATVSATLYYRHLDKSDLEILLYYTNQAAALRFYQKYNLQLTFQPS